MHLHCAELRCGHAAENNVDPCVPRLVFTPLSARLVFRTQEELRAKHVIPLVFEKRNTAHIVLGQHLYHVYCCKATVYTFILCY